MREAENVVLAEYKIVLQACEPLHVGGKPDPLSGAHNPIAAIDGVPVIPGSTLKGAYRALLERYLNLQYYDENAKRWKPGKEAFQPCIPGAEVSPDEQTLVKAGKYAGRNGSCHYHCDTRNRRHGNMLHPICPACYLLGCQGLIGFVSVPMLKASNAIAHQLYSARIDRATGTVTEGANRPYQFVPAGAEFTGMLYVIKRDNHLNWTLGRPRELSRDTQGDLWLQNSTMEPAQILSEFVESRFPEITRIGGFKSKGFGAVEIKIK